MSDALIFAVGCVFFIATSWATISFGLVRVGELKRQDLEASGREVTPTESGYTEIYTPPEDALSPSETQAVDER